MKKTYPQRLTEFAWSVGGTKGGQWLSHKSALKKLKWSLSKMNPSTFSEHFLFSIKFHSMSSAHVALMLGVCGAHHPEENAYFGFNNKGIGGWGYAYHSSGIYDDEASVISPGDIITVEVDKKGRKIGYSKGKQFLGCFSVVDLPEELHIAMAVYYSSESDLVEFVDLSAEAQKNRAEIEKNQEEKRKQISSMVQGMPKLYERMTLLEERNKLQEMNNRNLTDRVVKLEQENNKILKENEELKQSYEKHYDKFHKKKFRFVDVQFDPPMNKLSCFQNEEYEMMLNFACVGNEHTPVDLTEAEITLNGKTLENPKVLPRSLEFKLKFAKLGSNEFKIDFKNVKNLKFTVQVGSSEIFQEKCKVVLSCSEEEDTSKFRVGQTLEAQIVFKNENGTNLPFRVVNATVEDLNIKFRNKTTSKRVAAAMIDLEEDVFCDGTLDLGDYKLDGKFVPGTYEIVVLGDNLNLRKKFVLE